MTPGSAGEPWRDMYAFAADLEFRAPDFEMMNHWTSTSRKTIFTQRVICNKMVANDEGEIVGTLGLMRELKRSVDPKWLLNPGKVFDPPSS